MNNYKSIDGVGEFKVDTNNIDTRQLDIYVVHAKRWGDDEKHSYIVTATLNRATALSAAEAEEIERGGKYGCEVISFNCGEKTVIRKPYDDKSVCFNCEFHNARTGLICQQCMNFNNWSKRA